MELSPERILIVEDEEAERAGLAENVESWGYHPETARDGQEALEKLAAVNPAVLITDLIMPRLDGLGLLRHLREDLDRLPAIVLTARDDEEALRDALELGAFWFLVKPPRMEWLRVLVQRAVQRHRAHREREALEMDLLRAGKLAALVGESRPMQEIFRLVLLVAPSKASVLITGESGTGKEVVARTIHHLSPRRERPFIAINCSAIPETLMESEIFGHERGAFTGAMERRAGCFELAQNGTLLLDEIGEMPAPTQAKLLRVLEDSQVRRLGSKTEIEVDVRVLASTNKDPEEAVRRGELRKDLYYRLNVFHIHMPLLREHLEDLPQLAEALLKDLGQKHGRRPPDVAPAVLERFRTYSWPGNVRELRNVLERALITCDSEQGPIQVAHLPPSFGQSQLRAGLDVAGAAKGPRHARIGHAGAGASVDVAGPPQAGADGLVVPVGTTVAEAERLLILETLASTHNNKTRAAEVLGISLKTLHNKLKEYEAQRLPSRAP